MQAYKKLMKRVHPGSSSSDSEDSVQKKPPAKRAKKTKQSPSANKYVPTKSVDTKIDSNMAIKQQTFALPGFQAKIEQHTFAFPSQQTSQPKSDFNITTNLTMALSDQTPAASSTASTAASLFRPDFFFNNFASSSNNMMNQPVPAQIPSSLLSQHIPTPATASQSDHFTTCGTCTHVEPNTQPREHSRSNCVDMKDDDILRMFMRSG